MKKKFSCIPVCLLVFLLLLGGCTGAPGTPVPETTPETEAAVPEFWIPTGALIIGCDHFLTQPETAPVSANNTEILRAMTETVEPLVLYDAIGTRGALEEAVNTAFGSATEKDVNLVYISTHGIIPENEGPAAMTLLFSDGEQEVSVSPAELRELLDRIPGRKVLILDTCYSGAVIGKGTREAVANSFASPNYLVITSCGAEEKSWFWASSGNTDTGTGYFTGALRDAAGDFAAETTDADGDGRVTLRELKTVLRDLCGSSVVQTWPEDGEQVLALVKTDEGPVGIFTSMSFENGALDPDEPRVAFSFRVREPIRMIYQVIYDKGGQWDFDRTSFLFDDAEPGGILGTVSAGYKERFLSLGKQPEGTSGYALLQVIAMSRTVPSMPATRALCVAPAEGDPALDLILPERFCPSNNEELNLTVNHAFPCELTVSVLDAEGRVVVHPAVGEASRPQGRNPGDSFFCWNGKDRDGDPAPAGEYRVRVRVTIGDTRYEILSDPVTLEP